MTPFELDLYVEKSSVVRAESVRFVATLTSKAAVPEEIRTLEPDSRALTIKLVDADGAELVGEALNLTVREGETPASEPFECLTTLAPGAKLQATGDVLTWVGEVPPGEYRMSASYDHSSNVYATSKEVPLSIAPAAPLSATAVRPNAIAAFAPRSIAWRNGGLAAPELFLLKTSPYRPEVYRSNRPFAKLPPDAAPLVSTAPRHPPAATHVVWIEGANVLKALRLPGDAAAEKPVDVPLPIRGMRILREPYSDKKGGLAAVLAAPDLGRAMFLRLPPGGKPVATPINPRPPLSDARQAFWTRDEKLVLLWADPDRREIHGAMTPIAEPANPLEGKRLFTAPFPILHLRAYQDYDSRRETYGLKCVVLSHDRVKDMFVRLRVDLATGAVAERETALADGLGRIRVLQSELDQEHRVAFLLANPGGHALFVDPDLKVRPLEVEKEVPVTEAMSPALLAANRFSSSPGFSLLFVRDGERFEVRKL